MSKKEDIYNTYYNIDEMLNSINIKKEDIIEDADEVVVIEEYDELDEMANNEIINEDDIEVLDINLDKTQEIKLPEEIIDVVNNEEIDTSKKLEEIDQIFNEDKEEIENNSSKKKVKNHLKGKRRGHKLVITFGVLDLVAVICLFLMYGPIAYFRNLWVTSAMTTMRHQYLAYIFFNENSINRIIENNKVIEGTDNTNQGDINFNGEDNGVYASIYDEQVLKRDSGNDLYKVIDVEGANYKGHLLVVYDASRVHLAQASTIKYGGKQLENLVKENDAIAGTNASGFSRIGDGLVPTGNVIMGGKIITTGSSTGWGGGIIGLTYDNKLVLTRSTASEAIAMGIRDAVSFGPFLIVNGVPSEFKGNGGYGLAPRTAIGQRKDGIMLLLVIDGRRPGHSIGVDMVELTDILLKYGAYNASNLDGGGSSSIVVNGEVLSVAGGSGYTGERFLPNAWIVK